MAAVREEEAEGITCGTGFCEVISCDTGVHVPVGVGFTNPAFGGGDNIMLIIIIV